MRPRTVSYAQPRTVSSFSLSATLDIPRVPYELNSDDPIAGTTQVGKSSDSTSRAPRERPRRLACAIERKRYGHDQGLRLL
jgi:hypothetical protein